MVLSKLPVPGRPTIWMIVGQGPIALAVGAGGGCLDIFVPPALARCDICVRFSVRQSVRPSTIYVDPGI